LKGYQRSITLIKTGRLEWGWEQIFARTWGRNGSSVGMCGDGSETGWGWVGTDIKSAGTDGMGVISVPVQASNQY